MRTIGFILAFLSFALLSRAQTGDCAFTSPQLTINFGEGDITDPNISHLNYYRRVNYYCPQDGFYSFAPYTIECFHNDWHTLYEDHTPGDKNGNMLLVNAARNPGEFLRTEIKNLKPNTIYEIGLWLLNLCKPTKKCPTVLLPDISIRLLTEDGKIIANFITGPLPRFNEVRWIRHHAIFTTPSSASSLILVLIDNKPSGCGNDFALDDITFRECVKRTTKPMASTTKSAVKKQVTKPKPAPKKVSASLPKKNQPAEPIKAKDNSISKSSPVVKQNQKMAPAPLILKTRENELVKKIATEEGVIQINLYDNGQIDGDTVSIYHNNTLIRSRMRLSQKPISFTITINPEQSHHEIIMVAENLGSIPPNTSVMIVTTKKNRYEIFISSSEQKNAKVVFDLKQ